MASPKKRLYGDWTLYRRLLGEARPFWGSLTSLFFLSLLAAPLGLLMPVPVTIVIDHVLGDKPMRPLLAAVLPDSVEASKDALLWTAAGSIVFIALLTQLQQLGTWLLNTWVGQRLILRFRARLFDHLQRLSLGFHHEKGTADSVYRLQFDAPSIQSVAIDGVIPFATAIVKVLVLVVATALLDWQLALIALLGGPVLFGLTELYRKRLRLRWQEVRERESSAMAVVQETLGAVRVVKAFGQEERENLRYQARGDEHVSAAMKAVWAHGSFDIFVGVVTGLGAAGILFLGARHVQDGSLTLGELMLVVAYLSQLFAPLREIGTRVASLQSALASAERVFAVLDERPSAKDRPDAQPIDRARGEVRFEDVTFGYDPEEPIIRDVNVVVPAGSKVGIAGRTGSGKSTLLKLLPRFYEPQRGRVLLDGTDLRDIRLRDLRNQFGIVLQEAVLFATTIRENIAYGRPGATDEQIEQAARDAAAHDFIVEQELGYDTPVGERGMRLSGGERQRVALARAFLRDAPILILDEPTSALDKGTEAEVMHALERLMKGRTTFMIAHRLSTLASCDIRLQIEAQRVILRDGDVSDVAMK